MNSAAGSSKTSFLSSGNLISFAELKGGKKDNPAAVGYIIKNFLPNLQKPETMKKLFQVASAAFKMNVCPDKLVLAQNLEPTPELFFPMVQLSNFFSTGAQKGTAKYFGVMMPSPLGAADNDEFVKVKFQLSLIMMFCCTLFCHLIEIHILFSGNPVLLIQRRQV
jgi:hypothetical protein